MCWLTFHTSAWPFFYINSNCNSIFSCDVYLHFSLLFCIQIPESCVELALKMMKSSNPEPTPGVASEQQELEGRKRQEQKNKDSVQWVNA